MKEIGYVKRADLLNSPPMVHRYDADVTQNYNLSNEVSIAEILVVLRQKLVVYSNHKRRYQNDSQRRIDNI